MEQKNDKRSKRIGFIASLSFHGAIALLLFLLVAWKAPNPPLPEYGVEINLGFSDEGGGDIQPQTEVGKEGLSEETNSQPQETQPLEQTKEEVTNQQQEEVVTDESNPVSVKEEKKEVKEEVKKEIPKEVKIIPKEENKVIKEEAVFTPAETTDKTTTQKKDENLSQGNDKNKTGDKGQLDGVNDDFLYKGPKGGGAGGTDPGLNLAGWTWDRKPAPKIPENESGRLVFEIWVDENGDIARLVPIERGLSPEAEKICRDEIRKLTFSQTGANVPSISKGKITFVVKAQ